MPPRRAPRRRKPLKPNLNKKKPLNNNKPKTNQRKLKRRRNPRLPLPRSRKSKERQAERNEDTQLPVVTDSIRSVPDLPFIVDHQQQLEINNNYANTL